MLKKIFLPTVVISGTLLAGFGALLITQGSKPVQIQLENRQVFDGQLRDILTPQIGALLTLGVTVATASVLAWHQSAKESSKLEKRVSQLQTEILYKDAQISELKVAPTSPMLSSLNWFLDRDYVASLVRNEVVKEEIKEISVSEQPVLEEIPIRKQPTKETVTTASVVEQPVLPKRPATKPLVAPMSSVAYQVITTPVASVQTATSALPTAQSVLGLTQRYSQTETVNPEATVSAK
ncbi:MAG: hypothetical protein IGS39_20470 [Calothrix sp. C42_A2020_038]|nr:hypothetical protein [Calothrix sp. C42_A2020_038]